MSVYVSGVKSAEDFEAKALTISYTAMDASCVPAMACSQKCGFGNCPWLSNAGARGPSGTLPGGMPNIVGCVCVRVSGMRSAEVIVPGTLTSSYTAVDGACVPATACSLGCVIRPWLSDTGAGAPIVQINTSLILLGRTPFENIPLSVSLSPWSK